MNKPAHHHIRAYDYILGLMRRDGTADAAGRGLTPEARQVLTCVGKPADRARRKEEKAKVAPKFNDGRDDWDKMQEEALDALSEYVRTRDTRPFADGSRRGACCTCTNPNAYNRLTCGHWITRAKWGTKFHPFNNHAQCWPCNDKMRGNGRPKEHREYIINKHGADWPGKLERLALVDKREKTIDELRKIRDEMRELTAAVLARERTIAA